jgi:hypothetical protein
MPAMSNCTKAIVPRNQHAASKAGAFRPGLDGDAVEIMSARWRAPILVSMRVLGRFPGELGVFPGGLDGEFSQPPSKW